MLHAVIMAGGSGTRFWPLSTQAHPKQFLSLFGDRTLLQATADRIAPSVPNERLWVITNQQYVDLVKTQLPDIPEHHIIGEPVAKNTAPCVAAAATLIAREDPAGTMLVLPADHLISQTGRYLSVLKTAEATANSNNCLVTIGIKPDRPETGYGYIELSRNGAADSGKEDVYEVKQFREKPDLSTAKEFVASGNFLWNSGMFVWKAATIARQFKKHLPEVYSAMDALSEAIKTGEQAKGIHSFYHSCPSVSVDYGIMEKAESVFVVPGDFGWNDVGSWQAVYDLCEKDADGNVIQTRHLALESSKNNLINSKSGKMIALVGVKNMAVVETETAILICRLDMAQEVKGIVGQLEAGEESKKFL